MFPMPAPGPKPRSAPVTLQAGGRSGKPPGLQDAPPERLGDPIERSD